MIFTIDTEQEEDTRWIAEIVELPGVLVYGNTRNEAIARAKALALRTLAEKLEHDERLSCNKTSLASVASSRFEEIREEQQWLV